MKIAIASDLHLETLPENFDLPDADVLLLAGDICIIADLHHSFSETTRYIFAKNFFRRASQKYRHVIYVPGNHDHWDSEIDSISAKFNAFCINENLPNVIMNPKGVMQVDDVKFVYATLWTDFNKYDPIALINASREMNDYLYIHKCARTLTADDIVTVHKDHRSHIEKYSKEHDKVVVMTHHAPHELSNGTRASNRSQYYVCQDMEDLILDNPQIKYWLHGHTHIPIEYKIGETTVLSNPHGYSFEWNTFNMKIIEL